MSGFISLLQETHDTLQKEREREAEKRRAREKLHGFGTNPMGALSPREKEVAALFPETPPFRTLAEASAWIEERKKSENLQNT